MSVSDPFATPSKISIHRNEPPNASEAVLEDSAAQVAGIRTRLLEASRLQSNPESFVAMSPDLEAAMRSLRSAELHLKAASGLVR